MDIPKKLTENFCCAKCRGKSLNSRIIILQPHNSVKALFTGELAAKYYVLTCALCGYTEMYDARVYALQNESVADKATIPQKI